MDCPNCLNKFDEDRRPRVLSCGHSFCLPCLRQVHSSNGGIVPCFQCRKEEYLDVDDIPTGDLTKEEEEEEEEEPHSGNCPIHGGQAFSLWCAECSQDMCPECRPFHQDLKHQVLEHSQAKSLILSKYSLDGQGFYECLVSIEAAIQDVKEMAQNLISPLSETLSMVQRHISENEKQNKVVERTSSLGALEDLLLQKSRRLNRNRVALQMQMRGPMSTLGAFESSAETLRRLLGEANSSSGASSGEGKEKGEKRAGNTSSNKKMQGPVSTLGASEPSAETLSHQLGEANSSSGAVGGEKENGEKRAGNTTSKEAAADESIVVVKNEQRVLSEYADVCFDLPPQDHKAYYTTHVKVQRTEPTRSREKGFSFYFRDDADRPMFVITCEGGTGHVETCTLEPTTGWLGPSRDQCDIQPRDAHRLTIVEGPTQYTTLIDGITVGTISKTGRGKLAKMEVTNGILKMGVFIFHATNLKVHMSVVKMG
ncbi:uncharacterized protein LOC143031187 [Oratosquilla oratoria]|uniref:uncharacterized protein LOC143031187 n=1 Tax=Oratosquilla oratoria TaxID=337810 RepID=UPI003F75F87F